MNTNKLRLIGLAFLSLAVCFSCNKEAGVAPETASSPEVLEFSQENAQNLDYYFFPKNYGEKSQEEMRSLFGSLDEEAKKAYNENFRLYDQLDALGMAETLVDELADDELLTDLDLSQYLSDDQLQRMNRDEAVASERRAPRTCLITLWACYECINGTVYVTEEVCCFDGRVCGPPFIRTWSYPSSTPYCSYYYCTG
ncbi:MAG: hypothetical protein AAFV95_03360 [Bacteroidota bacterium]